jgi:HipA-like C-terminal domain
LVCEFHAHQVLAAAGLAMPGAQLLDAGGRRFLEIPRFDRVGRGGRLGVVSLLALGAGEIARDWPEAARELLRRGLIDTDSLLTIQQLHAFGELIGNTDMHFGNLAFFLGEAMPLPVTPCYDMLPMLWSPGNQGEIVARAFSPAPPLPAQADSWREAAVWAEDFWARVVADPRLSEGFREIATTAGDTLHRLRQHVGS